MKYLVFLLLAVALPATASTQIVLDCTAPTTRTDGSAFTTADVGGYLYGMTQPAQARVSLSPALEPAPCHKVVAIPKGTCFRAGTTFYVTVTDKQVIPQTSAPATGTLTEDVCNLLPKPSAPTNVIVSHD